MSDPGTFVPPPPARGGGSCWKWGGIACLGCGCAGIIGVAILLAVTASRPEVRKAYSRIWSTAQEAGETVQRMQQVGEAINKYAQDNGRYPGRLSDLTPRYVAAEMLKATADPGAKSFVYHKPPANAPGSFRLLEIEIPNPVMPTQAPPIRYYWTKAGKLETPNAFQVEAERQQPRGVPEPPTKPTEPE